MVRRIEWLDRCASTNDEAARRTDPAVSAVAADQQTQGRGRRGRTWVSPPGCGLYLSWIVRPRFPAAHATALPLLAAVAAAELCEALGARPTLKWPNDLLLDGRKLAGVLCEAHVGGPAWRAVVGVGLNVRTPSAGYPADIPAVALDTRAPTTPSPRDLAPRLLDRLEAWHDRVAAEGLAPVIAAWHDYGPALGAPMRQGDVQGGFAGLSPAGALRLDTATGRREIVAGEVELVSKLTE